MMASGGITVDELKRQVGWKSSKVAAGSVEDTIETENEVSRLISKVVNQMGSSRQECQKNEPAVVSVSVHSTDVAALSTESGIRISNNETVRLICMCNK